MVEVQKDKAEEVEEVASLAIRPFPQTPQGEWDFDIFRPGQLLRIYDMTPGADGKMYPFKHGLVSVYSLEEHPRNPGVFIKHPGNVSWRRVGDKGLLVMFLGTQVIEGEIMIKVLVEEKIGYIAAQFYYHQEIYP